MPLAIVAVLVLLMKVLDIDPVARWSWWWVLAPFGLLFLWWEFIGPMIGWEKKAAEKKMKDDEISRKEIQKKTRGF